MASRFGRRTVRPVPWGRNDAANPDRHPSLFGDTPGSLGRNDHAAAGLHRFQTLLAPAGAGPPIGGWRRGDPVALAPGDVADVLAPAGAGLRIGGIWGDVTRGSVWLADDGNRVILSATSTDVVFYRDGGFYLQSAAGFIQEVTVFPFVDAARRAAPLVRIAEFRLGAGDARKIVEEVGRHPEDVAKVYALLRSLSGERTVTGRDRA